MNNYQNKLILSFLVLSCFMFFGFSQISNVTFITETGYTIHNAYDIESKTQLCFEEDEHLSMSRDCTVRIKTDDIDIELTLHDVSRWDCFKLKVRAVWTRITGEL